MKDFVNNPFYTKGVTARNGKYFIIVQSGVTALLCNFVFGKSRLESASVLNMFLNFGTLCFIRQKKPKNVLALLLVCINSVKCLLCLASAIFAKNV